VSVSDLRDRKQQLYSALRAQLDERFAAAEEAGVDAAVFADTDAIVSAMVAALPAGNVYDQIGGPFYDTVGLAQWLSITKQGLAKRVAAGTLIGCQLADARSSWVYPVWQFTPEGQVIAHLDEVWRVLRDGAGDPWTALLWLRARNPTLGGATAADHLREGGDPVPVLAAARADAAKWAA
jgi:hypothetical protein